jgi:H+-transporting ATPase
LKPDPIDKCLLCADLTLAIIIFGHTPVELTLTVFIAIFSDISALLIAYDLAPYSQQPVRWNLSSLMFRAIVLGLGLAAGTWVLHGITLTDSDYRGKTTMMVFLEISFTQSWLIFSTRTGGGFWKFWPSWRLITSAVVVDIVASIVALFADRFAETINMIAVVRVWIFSVGVFLLVDFTNAALGRASKYNDLAGAFGRYKRKVLWNKYQLRDLQDHILVLNRIPTSQRPDDVSQSVPLWK